MNKVINKVLSGLLSIALLGSSFVSFPISVQAADTNLSNVKIYAENEDLGAGLTKVVDNSIQNWAFEIWHYSGGYWGNNTCKIMDKDFVKSEGGVADLRSSLTLDTQTFIYNVPSGSDLEKAIIEGKEVHINLSSGNPNIKLSRLYDIQTEYSETKDEYKYKTNEDGTLLSTDGTATIIKENGLYKIKVNVKPILNYYVDDKDYGLSYTKNYGLALNKWIPFVENGFGYQVYSMWRNNKNIGMTKGWVNQAAPQSLEGMEEGTIHPTMITNNIGQLKRGLKIHVDYQNGKEGWETISDSNDVRIGWYTLKDAGAVGMHFVFPVALDIYVDGGYPNGKVVTSYVKFAGVNEDGSPKYEKIKTEVEPAELNEDGSVRVEEVKEIDEGTAYLNDVLTSHKDLTQGTENGDLIDWTKDLPTSYMDKINPTAEDIWSFNLSIRMGILNYIEAETLVDSEDAQIIKALKTEFDTHYLKYRNSSNENDRQKAYNELNKTFSTLLASVGLSSTFFETNSADLKQFAAYYITNQVEEASKKIVKESLYISNIRDVKVYNTDERDKVIEQAQAGDALYDSYTATNHMSGVTVNGVISGAEALKSEEKTTLYLRYIVQPERKVRNFIKVYKNGQLISTEVTTSPLPIIESGDGYEPAVEIPTVEGAELVEWRTSKDLPLHKTMPTSPLKQGTTLSPISLDSDENLYVEWKKEIFVSTVVPDNRLLVEQWRLSKYTDNLGYQTQAYMNLNLTPDESSCISSTLSNSGKYNYKIINPNGQYASSNYNPLNYNYNDYIHSKALTQGSYSISHSNPSVLVNMTGNLNLIKGTNTFGIKAASWMTDNSTKQGLSQHNIETANVPVLYSGSSTVSKSDVLKYGIENSSTYRHKYTIYDHYRCYHRTYSHIVCDCYRLEETRQPKSKKITYETADYKIDSTFDRYIAKAGSKLSVNADIKTENGKTTVSYQAPYELKIYPEVAMLFDNDKGDSSVKWVIGEQARVINPVMYHTMQFKVFVDETSTTPNFATDSRARTKAQSMGLSQLHVVYKGSPLNTTFKVMRNEGSSNTGLLTVKTFALDVSENKNGVNVKNAWGLSGYNSLNYHKNFLNQWTFKGTASEKLEIQTSGLFQGGIKSQNISLSEKKYNGSNTTTFTHELIVRGGQVVGVKMQDRNNNSYSIIPIGQLQSKDAALYEALENMKLIGNKENTLLKGFEHQTGNQLTEQKFIDLVKVSKQSLDGFITDNLAINKGWYSEDTTVLVVKEYVTNYDVPSISFSDKIPMSVVGLDSPIDKNQFFSTLGKGHTYLNYTLNSNNLNVLNSGLSATKVYFEHNSRTGSPFGKKNVDYLVGNVSVLDTTRSN